MRFLASVFLLWAVPVHASAGSISAARAPSECEELRHENERLRELLERLSARCPEPIETEPQSAARLGEERRAIRALLGTADAAVVSASAAVVEGETNKNECPRRDGRVEQRGGMLASRRHPRHRVLGQRA